MKRFFHTSLRRLRWKLTFSYALVTFMAVLMMQLMFEFPRLFEVYLRLPLDQIPTTTVQTLHEISPQAAPYLLTSPPDREALARWMETTTGGGRESRRLWLHRDMSEQSMSHQVDIMFMAVLDTEGHTLVSTHPHKIPPDSTLTDHLASSGSNLVKQAMAGELDPIQLSVHNANGTIAAAAPILGTGQQVIGVLYVTLAEAPTRLSLLLFSIGNTIFKSVAAILPIVIITGVVFGLVSTHGLTRRIRSLEKTVNAWSRGDFSVIAHDASGDEIGVLTQHLNAMAEDMQTLLQTRQQLAALEERQHLARELHDAIKQQVFACAMQIGSAHLALSRGEITSTDKHLTEAKQLVRQVRNELNMLIHELHPIALTEKGLATVLREYVADWSRQQQIPVHLEVEHAHTPNLEIEQAFFRVAQEALANIAQHSKASHVTITYQPEKIELAVSDDGVGFDVTSGEGIGLGLHSMRERIEMLGGQLTVVSTPGQGTQVCAHIHNISKEHREHYRDRTN